MDGRSGVHMVTIYDWWEQNMIGGVERPSVRTTVAMHYCCGKMKNEPLRRSAWADSGATKCAAVSPPDLRPWADDDGGRPVVVVGSKPALPCALVSFSLLPMHFPPPRSLSTLPGSPWSFTSPAWV